MKSSFFMRMVFALLIALWGNAASALLQGNQLTGFNSSPSLTATQISQSAGSVVGDMVNGGGLAAAFDGNENQDNAATANNESDLGVTGSCGKNWGSGVKRIVTKFVIISSSNLGFGNTSGTANITLGGSNDGSSWTTLFSTSFAEAAGITTKTYTTSDGIDASTYYQYHRVTIQHDGVYPKLAELKFYEDQ